jgi:HEAT repeat protein
MTSMTETERVGKARWTALVASGFLAFSAPLAAQATFRLDLGRVQALIDAGAAQLDRAGQRAMTGLVNLRPVLADASFRLQAIAPTLGRIDLELGSLGGGEWSARPPASWDAQDPGDSLYRAARSTLNRSDYTKAAYLFSEIHERYPRSTYAADAYYWEAFARYRQGSTDNLKSALRLLERQIGKYPDASTHDDATSLAERIRGRLARGGDVEAAKQIKRKAEEAGDDDARSDRPSKRGRGEWSVRGGDRCRDDDDDEKMAALNALLQMDEDRALPILKKVMSRRDPESVCLRRKAVFLISQHSGSEAESMLLAAVRNDPDREVREQGVFWLSQVGGEHAAIALDSILRGSDDPAVQEKAIFALSQHNSERAMRSLRDYAVKTDAPRNLRENAIFWLGQSDKGGENAGFLKSLYKEVKEDALKEKIIFSIAQHGSRDNQRWLIELAGDSHEDVEIRKKAIFWAGQSGIPLPELFSLYDRAPEREIKEGLIFAYSQRSDKAAVDKLIQIARTEKDRDLRKNAMFWLSQSKDPRVADLLEEMLNK